MVTVQIEWGAGKCPTTLTANGHAGHGKPGRDTVCAALSVLFYTAASLVEEWEEKGYLLAPATLNLGEGVGEIAFVPKPGFAHVAKCALETAVRGMELLSNYYPNYVTLIRI